MESTFNIIFPALLHARLTGYNTIEEQGLWKSINLLQRFILFHNVKPIAKFMVFLCLFLAFSQLLPLIWVEKWKGFVHWVLCFSFGQHNSEVSLINQWTFWLFFLVLPLDDGEVIVFYVLISLFCFSFLKSVTVKTKLSFHNCDILHDFNVGLFWRHPFQCGYPWSLTGMGIEWCGLNRK